jgi:hypothetical protein
LIALHVDHDVRFGEKYHNETIFKLMLEKISALMKNYEALCLAKIAIAWQRGDLT